MLPFAKILLPVDFSERSPGAVRYARVLACRYKSELTLLHVLEPPHYELSGLEIGGGAALTQFYNNRAAQAKEDLEGFLADELAGLPLRRVVLEGDTAQRIVEHAHNEGVNLIVMPTHGYGPFRRFILGSVTAKVLHDADCPVWTGAHMEAVPAAGTVVFHHVLCAVDLGPHSAKVLGMAAGLTADLEAKLTILHATPALEAGQARYFDPQWRVTLAKQAREQIDTLKSAIGTPAEVVIEPGDIPKVVASVAKREQADVIVIGRGHTEGVLGRLRAHSYAIIRESPCPVLSV